MEVVNGLGVSSARYCSCFPFLAHDPASSDTLIPHMDVPMGSCVMRWDLAKRERTKFFRAHRDVVKVLRKSPAADVLLTVSDLGEVALWDVDWNLIARAKHSGDRAKVKHAAFSPDGSWILTSAEHGKGFQGLFKVSGGAAGQVFLHRETEFGQDESFTFAEFVKDDASHIFAIQQQIGVPDTSASLVLLQRRDDESSREKEEEADGAYFVVKRRELVTADKDKSVYIAARNENMAIPTMAIARGRMIEIVDMHTLEPLWTVNPQVSGLLKAFFFRGETVACQSSGDTIGIWNKEERVGTHHLPPDSGTVYYLNLAPNAVSQHLVKEDAVTTDALVSFIITEATLHAGPVSLCGEATGGAALKDHSHISFHHMTCCGLDFNAAGSRLAVGDFAGNIMIWSAHQQHPHHDAGQFKGSPLLSVQLPVMVRSVCWRKGARERDAEVIFVGGLGGEVFLWEPRAGGSVEAAREARQCLTLDGAVTCMRWENAEDPRLVALVTAGGTLYVYEMVEGTGGDGASGGGVEFKERLTFKAHPPVEGPQDLNFGSLGHYAEIWSVTWSPRNDCIATSSEDQSTRIWNLKGELLHVLKGHTTAVTSVDWQFTSVGEILATCADDRTVMVWNANTWELYHVFDTKEQEEWHTMTYLALEGPRSQRDGSSGKDEQVAYGGRVACATQNGCVFVWSLETKEKIFGEKMHEASIEGLVWSHRSGLIASCASDCTVNVYSLAQSSNL